MESPPALVQALSMRSRSMNHIAAIVQPGRIVDASPKRTVAPADDAPADVVAAPRAKTESGHLERVWVPDASGAPIAVWRFVPASPAPSER
jgi:hypothetical protein